MIKIESRSKDRKKGNIAASSFIANLADSSEISINKTTKQRLEGFGSMNETYDSFINKLLDHINTCDKWWVERS